MQRVTNYLAHIVSQNRHEWKPPQLWRPNSCGIFSVSSRHSPSQRPNLKLLATEISSPALGYPVHVSCVRSIFSCDTPFYSLAAQLHIRAAVRTTSFRKLKLLVWSADRDAAETRGADVCGQGTSATVTPACLVWTGWERDEGKRGENKEGKKRRKKVGRGKWTVHRKCLKMDGQADGKQRYQRERRVRRRVKDGGRDIWEKQTCCKKKKFK